MEPELGSADFVEKSGFCVPINKWRLSLLDAGQESGVDFSG